MKYAILPNSNIKSSKICLGIMTFGNQNTEAEAPPVPRSLTATLQIPDRNRE
jgi:aryl-alcohol dehydrogenase-like predicted oxidoreductase